ncbi:nudix hydrolase 2 isoform X2 [Rosa chinensis]|uniref:nudix hydrolase 2 isoform X2 n=1 Tax=Rosa chinensis TaxID=74649 RepID=UPI001AD91A2B|nr:nudix hydrolase 2 isoform X2 [Rosa chinensis]
MMRLWTLPLSFHLLPLHLRFGSSRGRRVFGSDCLYNEPTLLKLQSRSVAFKYSSIIFFFFNSKLKTQGSQQGFWYHHAEPHYLMLVYWLHKSAHTLPENATHRLGIGAFLINQNREVLVVQEKGGQYGGTGVWKLPTGAVDEGEDIYAAAVREVKEETGIDSEFIEILAFRQIHKSFFQKSDLFFLCMLRPLSFDIQKQEQEIEAAKWMPFEEYAAQPYAQKYEFLMYLHDICIAKIDGNYTGFSPIPTTSYSVQKSYLYLNSTEAPKRYSKL